MSSVTLEHLQQTLDSRFHGILLKGKHEENGECCALELLAVCKEIPWTDNPTDVGSFDLRPINDIDVSDDIRTIYLLPVIVAYSDSRDWTKEKQNHVVKNIVILTVQRLISQLYTNTEEIKQQCLAANTLEAAYAAADAAAADAAAAAAAAAYAAAAAARAAAARAADAAAAEAAAAAAYAARAADAETIFIEVCNIWIEAAQ